MSITDDLAPLFGVHGAGVTIRQGQIVEWTTGTGENQVNLGGVIVENLPLLIAESTVLQPGDMVLILSSGESAFVMGKVTEPGEPNTIPTWSADITELTEVTVPAVAATAAAAQSTATTAQTTADTAAADAATAAAAAATALGKFPITETDIQDGSISTPKLAADAIDGLVITGSEIRTSATGQRIALNDPAYPGQILLASGNSNEVDPGLIRPILGGANYGLLELRSPDLTGSADYCWINLEGYDDGHSSIEIQGTNVDMIGEATVDLLAPLIRLTDGSDAIEFAGATITADVPVTITAPSVDIDGVLTKATVPVLTTAEAQTVTNKDLTSASNTFLGRMLTQNLTAAMTGAAVTVPAVEADVAGAAVTFNTTRANARYVVTASFYFGATTGGGGVAAGKLNVDGANQAAFANFTGATNLDRANVAQSWTGTLAAVGSHTLKLRHVMTGAGVFGLNPTHTTLTVQIFE